MQLTTLARGLRDSRGFAHKRDLAAVMRSLAAALPGGARDMAQAVAVGDDCAALPVNGIDGAEGYLLFAIEGLVADFIEAKPWFAGYSAVMVNVSDIYAMGGRPLAVVDAIWGRGMDTSAQVFQGMAAASAAYGVPIVGGHSNQRNDSEQLAVAILGRADKLLTSFDARPGDALVMAIDLRGAFVDPFPYWNASTEAPPERLRADLELLPELAESGLCDTAKDISMAGAIGSALMLAECSRVGAVIDVEAIPRPAGAPLPRWLGAFPSYGYVLSVRPAHLREVLARFRARGIAAEVVGEVHAGSALMLRDDSDTELLWDWQAQPFITAGGTARRQDSHA